MSSCCPVGDYKVLPGGKPSPFSEIRKKFISEFFGTFLFVLIGLCSISSSVFAGAQSGVWQVAIVWGLGVALAVYATSTISGAHLNPAISLTMLMLQSTTGFTFFEFCYYCIAQLLGAFVAAALNYTMWSTFVHNFESNNDISRGEKGSEVSAQMFCGFFPNPGMFSPLEYDHLITPAGAMGVEIVGSSIMSFCIFALTDPQNGAMMNASAPVLIGTVISVIISLIAPMTSCILNPARDLGPRIFAAMVGWGHIALPGPHNGFWVYIVGPCIGTPLGALLYNNLLHKGRPDNHRTSRIGDGESDKLTSLLQHEQNRIKSHEHALLRDSSY
jgi:glycerol uptake facilitator protein